MKPLTAVEGRGGHTNRSAEQNIQHTGGVVEMENAFRRIALQAEKHSQVQTLMHYVNKETLTDEHRRQQHGKATGTDRIDKEKYGKELDANLERLLSDMKAFRYRPQAVRRTYIPKTGSDKLRPLGIPSYEDRLVQGVMRRILDQIYEGKFYDFSYGFREGKSCHQAISEVQRIVMSCKVNYVVDADIRGFFDNVNHEWLLKFLGHDIGDRNFLRYVSRFLKAGIIEEMRFYESDKGTPQGGLISPVLANVYLHYALDMWFEMKVKKQCRGEAHIVRYADDFVCFFQYESEAKGFFEALKARLEKFGLELAEEKSKIIKFGRFARTDSVDGKTESFDFLGFTHINGQTRAGKYRLEHRTSRKKLEAKKQVVKEWLRENIHGKASDTIKLLNRKLIGHYRYYGISGNQKGLLSFYRFIVQALYSVLTRRSQRTYLTWARYRSLLRKHPILEPKIYVNIWGNVRSV